MSAAASSAPAAVPPAPTATYDPLCEKRFAVVIYGGVSLAIYINGIVQEMLALVRATAPATPDLKQGAPLLSGDPQAEKAKQLTGSEKVYRKLGQLLGPDGNIDKAVLKQMVPGQQMSLPIQTRFVVDVLSGTSAGGINAMFLAKALATNGPLRNLQTLWQEEGDIAKLINDTRSLEGPLRAQDPPQSLLNSHRMYLKLLAALDEMDGDAPKTPSPLVDALDLFSTTTDIAGLVLPITLADRVVDERRHRNVFHFRHVPKGPLQKTDFTQATNPFLAYAARCTSAFPFAFEPMALCDIFPILRASPIHSKQPYCNPDTTAWQEFYLDYIGDPDAATRSEPFQLRPFGDGGYLDNKPFSYAIETLLARHADLPVDRKLVYIEPSPDVLRTDTFEIARPDAIENSLAALLTLPRYETIRQDLETVVNRNFEVERVNRILSTVIPSDEWKSAFQPTLSNQSQVEAKTWVEKGLDSADLGYLAYEQLKVTTVTDDLADLLARAFKIDPHSAQGEGVRVLAQVWRNINYGDATKLRQFLLDYDVAYRLRRFRHVWREINRLNIAIGAKDAAFAEAYRRELRNIKSALETPYLTLKDLLERLPLPPGTTNEVMLTVEEMTLVVEPPASDELAQWPE
jgi:patatin-related protein